VRRAERILVFFGALISALLVLLIVMMVGSDDSEPVAGDVSSSTEATTTTAIAGGSDATVAPGTTVAPGATVAPDTSEAPGVTVAPDTSEAPPGTTGGTETEFSWDGEIDLDVSYPSRNSRRVMFKWDDATGEEYYKYRFHWETYAAADSGDDIDALPQDTDRHTIDAPCGVTFSFELLAWDASDGELGRKEAFASLGLCESPPSNLRNSSDGHLVRFEWDHATGHDRYVYQVTTSGAGVESRSFEGPITRSRGVFIVEARCWVPTDFPLVVDFTLIAIADRDGAEIGRLTDTYRPASCP